MDVITAAFNVVHDADGGVPAMAQVLGKARGTLDHELNPPAGSSAKLGLRDAVKISKRARDFRILYAFAEECEHLCLPAPQNPSKDDSTEAVLKKACQLSRTIATSFEEMNAALADGTITPAELRTYERDAIQVIAAISDVVRAMRAKMAGDLERHRTAVEEARGSVR